MTADGFEKQIGVNVFGHHYLTKLLLPTLLKQAPKPCRVVCLSSTAHDMGSVDVSDLHFNKGRIYKPWVAYGQSKQGDLLYAKALAKQTRGTNVTAVSVHPGVIATNLWRTTNPLMKSFVQMFVMDKTVPQGAACSVYAALAPCLQQDSMRGVYLSDCHPKTPTCESARDEDGTVSESFYKVMDEQVNSVVSSWTK